MNNIYKKTKDTIILNNKKKCIYFCGTSKVKYVRHNKTYITLKEYKKNIKNKGGGITGCLTDCLRGKYKNMKEELYIANTKLEHINYLLYLINNATKIYPNILGITNKSDQNIIYIMNIIKSILTHIYILDIKRNEIENYNDDEDIKYINDNFSLVNSIIRDFQTKEI